MSDPIHMLLGFHLQIIFALNIVIYSIMEMEANGVSAERVHEYIGLPSEVRTVYYFSIFRRPSEVTTVCFYSLLLSYVGFTREVTTAVLYLYI